MINPKRFKWNDTEDNLKKANIDWRKLEKIAELAAHKIYPVYTAFNIEMGDRTPTVQYLSQIIFELAAGQIADPDDSYSWGGICLESTEWGEKDGDYFGFQISYHLGSYDFDEVTK